MTFPAILPLAGAALAPVLEKVIDGVTEGLPFLDILHQQVENDAADEVHASEPGAFQHDLVELVDRLREKLARLGVDLKTPLRLKSDGRDGVVVDGDHPDRVLVESVFGDDKALTKLFNDVANSAARDRDETQSSVGKDFRFVLGQTEGAD